MGGASIDEGPQLLFYSTRLALFSLQKLLTS